MSTLTRAQLDTLNRKRLAYGREKDPVKRDLLKRSHDALRNAWLAINYQEAMRISKEEADRERYS